MRNFRTNKVYLVFQFIISVLLIVLAVLNGNGDSKTNAALIYIMVAVSLVIFGSSAVRKVSVTEDNILIRNMFKSVEMELDSIKYGYALSAMGRYVIIINDGKKSAMISSLIGGFIHLERLIASKIGDEERGSFDIITEKSLKMKSAAYICFMLLITALILLAILKSLGYSFL